MAPTRTQMFLQAVALWVRSTAIPKHNRTQPGEGVMVGQKQTAAARRQRRSLAAGVRSAEETCGGER